MRTALTVALAQNPTRHRHGVRGFTLIELIIGISISAVLAVIANRMLAEASQESLARGSGSYLSVATEALGAQLMLRFPAYAINPAPIDPGTGLPMVSGFANPARPTLAELIAAGRLRAGFPATTPTRQTLRFDVITTNCPGPTCQITGLACTTTPVNFGEPDPRWDMVTAMYEEQRGRGAQATMGNPGTINGPTGAFPNPNGNMAGVVCGVTQMVDFALFDQYVRIRDTRDPDLRGNLTVAGTVTVGGPTVLNNTLNVAGTATVQNNLTVGGAITAGPCINLAGGAQGRAGFGCANPNDVPAGWTGGVRSADVVANRSILASDNPGAFTGNNGNFALVTADNGGGEAEMRTSGRTAANRLTPTGQFAAGAACAAADEGAIARLAGGPGLVSCTQGLWRVFTFQAAPNDPCSPNGATAREAGGRTMVCLDGRYQPLDNLFRTGTVNDLCPSPGVTAFDTSANNETLICRINLGGGVARWMRLRDVTSHLVMIAATEVTPNTNVAKPSCNGHASQTPVPVIQLIPKVWGTGDGGQAFFAQDNGPNWTVRMRDGTGLNLSGNPSAAAIAQLFCYFP